MNFTQHQSNNDVLAAPPGMTVEQCRPLPITRFVYDDGTPGTASYWKPTPQEIAMIVQGCAVRVMTIGRTHPPLSLGVDGDGQL